jgi:hypothetical protein
VHALFNAEIAYHTVLVRNREYTETARRGEPVHPAITDFVKRKGEMLEVARQRLSELSDEDAYRKLALPLKKVDSLDKPKEPETVKRWTQLLTEAEYKEILRMYHLAQDRVLTATDEVYPDSKSVPRRRGRSLRLD